MSNITIRIRLRDSLESEEFNLLAGDIQQINNVGIKTTNSGEFVSRSNNLQGIQLLSFAKDILRFDNNGILVNEDMQEGYLQSEATPTEFVFGATNENGEYSLELIIDNASALSSIVIYGDNLANQFPTVASVDGIPFYSDDYKLVIPFSKELSTHTIIFTKWNRANYNACLTVIRTIKEYLTYSNTAIESLQSIERSSTNGSEINYGSIANSGLIELIDEDDEIKDLVNDGVIKNSNVPVDILFNNKILQYHISNDTNYDTTQGLFSISLSNKMDILDTLIYSGFSYPETSMTLYEILYKVMNSLFNNNLTDSDFKSMLSRKCITPDEETYIYDYLQNIIIEYPIIEYGYTYRQVIDDICKIAQLNLFINKDNNFEFISARPLLLSGETDYALRITKGTLKENPSYDLIMKNQYDAVDINENNVSDEVTYNKEVYKSDYFDYSSKTLDDYPYILDSELYTNTETSSYSIYYNSDYGSRAYTLVNIENYANYITAKYYYDYINLTIPKRNNNNLNSIEELKEYLISDSSKSYNMTYEKRSGKCSGTYDTENKKFTSISRNFTPSIIDPEFGGYEVTNGNGSLNGFITSSDSSITLEDYDNSKFVNVNEDDNNFYITLKILVSLEKISIWYSDSTTISSSGTFEKYLPKKLTISIYGNERIISFNNTSVSSSNIDSAQVIANFGNTNTKLLQDKCIYNGTKISTIIKDNILYDYKYGISNLRLEMFTTDPKDKDGNIIKNMNNGEVLSVGDVAFLTKDYDEFNQQRYWSVYDNEYTYDGSVDMSVQLNQKREYYGLYNDKYFLGWSYLINNQELFIDTYNITDLSYTQWTLNDILTLLNSDSTFNVYFETINNTEITYDKLLFISSNNSLVYGKSRNDGTNISDLTIVYTQSDGWISDDYKYIKFYYGNDITNQELINWFNDNAKTTTGLDDGSKYLYTTNNNQNINGKLIIASDINMIGKPDGTQGFIGCSNLTNINIPNSVKIIFANSFKNCTGLLNIKIPDSNTIINNDVFSGCTSLSKVIIPDTITVLNGNCFNYCTSLLYIYIPISVKTIEFALVGLLPPFYGCSSNLVIYCGAESKPDGWDIGWNIYYNNNKLQVKWGYTREEYENEINT